jgi:adenine deaminase
VAENGQTRIASTQSGVINNFSCSKKKPVDFEYRATGLNGEAGKQVVPVIEALDGQLITNRLSATLNVENGRLTGDISADILKMVVVNRYRDAPVAESFIRNFGLKRGAIASSVAHDSHNIVAVGVDDASLCAAVNLVIDHKGGVSCVDGTKELIVALPVAGLMSNQDGYIVAERYSVIDKAAKEAGCALASPFMTLSFMALLVIPHLKLSDLGLFDGDAFCFVEAMSNRKMS